MRFFLGAALSFLMSAAQAASPLPLPLPSLVPSPAAVPTPQASASIGTQQVMDVSETPILPPVELPDLTLDNGRGIDLTLEDSIHIAVVSATSVMKAQNDVSSTGVALLQSYAQFLPNLTAQGNYTYGTGSIYYAQSTPTLVQGSNIAAGYTLQTDLNIFNGLSDFAGLKSATLKKDASDLTFNRVKQQIALDITQSFLQVVLDNLIVNIARKNLQESQAREALLTEQTNLGVRNLSDLFRQQAQTSADESFLLTSENKTRTDQIAFLRKLRADVAKKYHFIEPKFPTNELGEDRFQNERELIKTAIVNRTDLKASDDLADASNWDVKVNFSGWLPKLDLIANAVSDSHYLISQLAAGANVVPATQPDMGYQLGNYIEYSVGLNLTWNIFDRLVTHENVVKAKATASNFEIDAEDKRNQVEGDVRRSFGDYKTAIQQLRASKTGLVAAQKAYEVTEGRYEVGSASFVDLVTAQAALVQAEAARAQAIIDFMFQGKTLEYAIGETRTEF